MIEEVLELQREGQLMLLFVGKLLRERRRDRTSLRPAEGIADYLPVLMARNYRCKRRQLERDRPHDMTKTRM